MKEEICHAKRKLKFTKAASGRKWPFHVQNRYIYSFVGVNDDLQHSLMDSCQIDLQIIRRPILAQHLKNVLDFNIIYKYFERANL
ncbi:UNVERIFIED_CONTAM: hypothetical protein RMT77_012888 [Armadillidium vulgare]